MQRRQFVTLLGMGGAAATQAALPRLVHAEVSTKRPLVAILGGVTRNEFPTSFMKGMRDLGYVKGDNIDVVYRFADGRMELLPSLAEELIHFTPKVIVDMPGRPDESAFEGGTDVPLKLDHFRC